MDATGRKEEKAVRDTSMIEGLARSRGVRLEEVRRLYESALARMKQDAIILDFLPIFAARQVKEILERKNELDSFEGPEAREG
jgi:hypothetical protein